MPNRLGRESSPYLRQHADNPVDWYPWGEEALGRARDEDRPILLSIGYSACHWCHVMERESFEDREVAALMNERFVNIKVDREERPDIDQVYMRAVQAITGSGGWPMTVFLTPDTVPYYGGTYFPPEGRHGLPSFRQVLEAASDAYRLRPDEVRGAGRQLVDALGKAGAGGPGGTASAAALDQSFLTLSKQYDRRHGGFGTAPKFPQPVTLELLLRHHLRTGEGAALDMVVHTLRRMAAGGMRDHLGGGFHRYSVDARWLVPHFEKMLYDNALLARAYLDAYRVTGAEDLRAVAEDTLDYLRSDLLAPEGGFYSARDADSEGEEGVFYVWTLPEIEEVLGSAEARLFARVYDVSAGGNFEGSNILHLPHEIGAVARSQGTSGEELSERLAPHRQALREARARREPPFRDEKVLTSWSSMAVRAFAEAGAALERPDYLEVATAGADFLWTRMRANGRLLHTYMAGQAGTEGEAKIAGFLDDHAALGNALLSLHGATLEPRWLDAARWLCDQVLGLFWDEAAGTVFDTPADGEPLLLRPRDPMDNATPSGPSLAAELLLRAGHVFDEGRYLSAAERILHTEANALMRFGPAFGRMLSVLDRWLAEPEEVVVIGAPGDRATRALIGAAHARLHRNLTVVGRSPEERVAGVPLLQDRALLDGRPAAYLCRRYACRAPVSEPRQVRDILDEEDITTRERIRASRGT